MPLPKLELALLEMRDMDLLEMRQAPFSLALKQASGKKDFYSTPTGRWLREEIHLENTEERQ